MYLVLCMYSYAPLAVRVGSRSYDVRCTMYIQVHKVELHNIVYIVRCTYVQVRCTSYLYEYKVALHSSPTMYIVHSTSYNGTSYIVQGTYKVHRTYVCVHSTCTMYMRVRTRNIKYYYRGTMYDVHSS